MTASQVNKENSLYGCLLLTILLLPFHVYTQELKGRIFNNDTPIQGVLVVNTNKSQSAFSDDEGYFLLSVRPGDSLKFSSIYYYEKIVVIVPEAIANGLVVEMRSKDIQLEEVVVDKKQQPKKFEPVIYSKELNVIIKEDMKKHPEKYAPANASYGLNFAGLFTWIGGLIKKKEKPESGIKRFLTSDDLEKVFQNHPLVNRDLLTDRLHITKERYSLFCQFLEVQQLKAELLAPDKELELLENVLNYASQFNRLFDQK